PRYQRGDVGAQLREVHRRPFRCGASHGTNQSGDDSRRSCGGPTVAEAIVSLRKLPLESSHWWPIADALEHRRQRTGADKLAEEDFNRALKAGNLRAQVRHANGSRELLAPSGWDEFRVVVWISLRGHPPRLGVSNKLGKEPRDQWFFVWLPDYEN